MSFMYMLCVFGCVMWYEMPQRFVQAFHSMALDIIVVPSQFHETHEKLNN